MKTHDIRNSIKLAVYKEKFTREKDPSYFGHGTSLEHFFVQNHDVDQSSNFMLNNNKINNNKINNDDNDDNDSSSKRQADRSDSDVMVMKNKLIDSYKSAIFDKNQLATMKEKEEGMPLSDDSRASSMIIGKEEEEEDIDHHHPS